MAQTIAIIGSGNWGAAFGGAIGGESCNLIFWDRDAALAEKVAHRCAGTATANLDEVVAVADLLIIAVSSDAFRAVLQKVTGAQKPLIWLCKGFDQKTNLPLCETAKELLGDGHFAVISGPSFADEVAAGLPTALTLAANKADDGRRWQSLLHRPALRLYLSDDLIGVCVAGAVKNIIAIAAGIAAGMRLGENAQASLITRGIAEMGALVCALGGKRDTLVGLAGVGDTFLTCSSNTSRNRRFGFGVGADNILAAPPGTTCEGIAAVRPVLQCAEKMRVEMPICRAVGAVVVDGVGADVVLQSLLSRALKSG